MCRTQEKINNMTAFSKELGLDLRIAKLCKYKYQIEEVYKLQEYANESSHEYIYRMQTAPKEKTKEHESAVKHYKALYDYLFIGGHRDEAYALSRIDIPLNISKAGKYKKYMKEYYIEKLNELDFAKTSQDEIAIILIEYQTGEHNSDAGDKSFKFNKIPEGTIPLIDGTKKNT